MNLFMVLKVTKWENLCLEPDVIRIKTEEGDYGFCRVFKDYGRAVNYAGDPKYVQAIKVGEAGC